MFSNIINIPDSNRLPWQEYLSAKEQEIYSSRKSPKRKASFLAGRLLTKYMLLQRIIQKEEKVSHYQVFQSSSKHCTEDHQAKNAVLNFDVLNQNKLENQTSECTLEEVKLQDLSLYPACLYQKVEILPHTVIPQKQETNDTNTTGYLQVFWCQERLPIQVSIAHHREISLASLSAHQHLGLDIESCEKRRQAFYDNSFTPFEKDWVFEKMKDWDVSKNWLFTLLWTLKEAGLKLLSSHQVQLSLWNIPALEIHVLEEKATKHIFSIPNSQQLHYFQCNIALHIHAKVVRATACIAFNQHQIITRLKETIS